MSKLPHNKRLTATVAQLNKLLDKAYEEGQLAEAAQHGPIDYKPPRWLVLRRELLQELAAKLEEHTQ